MRRIAANNLFMLRAVLRAAPAYACLSLLVDAMVAADNVIGSAVLVNFIYNVLERRGALSEALMGIGLTALLFAARYALGAYTEEALRPLAKARLMSEMQTALYERAVSMDLARYDAPEYYDKFIWAMKEADARALAVFDTAGQGFSVLLMLLGFSAVIARFDAFVLIPAALCFLTTYLLNGRRARINVEREGERKAAERRRDAGLRAIYLPECAKELRMTGIAKPILTLIADAFSALRETDARHGRRLARLAVCDQVLVEAVLLNGGVYAYLAYCLFVRRSIGAGELMALAFSVENLLSRLGNLAGLFPKFAEHSAYADVYRKFIAETPKIRGGERDVPKEGDIELINVKFSYRAGEEVLGGVSAKITRGERVALVGLNGAGKSTLIKLLLRLYDPDEGRILYGGVDIREYPLREYRAAFACAFQEFNIYAATLGENVALSARYDVKRVASALAAAGLALPADTALTREFDDSGVNLSGGEAQKVAIARALYGDAPTMILDEPSAALDPLAEREFNRVVASLPREKTAIIISHRLSTASVADRIILLEKGTIAEEGDHSALLALNGKYADMWRAQAKAFREERFDSDELGSGAREVG